MPSLMLADDFKCQHKPSYNDTYKFWYQTLANRLINVFEWDGLPVPTQDLEWYLALDGYAGFLQKDSEYYALRVAPNGVTAYSDVYIWYVYATPVISGTAKIGDDGLFCRNTSTSMPTIGLVRRYAELLTHADLSLIAALINTRATGIFFADEQSQVDTINKWYDDLTRGNLKAILDKSKMRDILGDGAGMRLQANQFPGSNTIKDYYDATQNLLKSFYADLGIKMAQEKRERMIDAEVAADDQMLIFNVEDMLEQRLKLCDEIKDKYGLNVSVKLRREVSRLTNDKEEQNDESSET